MQATTVYTRKSPKVWDIVYILRHRYFFCTQICYSKKHPKYGIISIDCVQKSNSVLSCTTFFNQYYLACNQLKILINQKFLLSFRIDLFTTKKNAFYNSLIKILLNFEKISTNDLYLLLKASIQLKTYKDTKKAFKELLRYLK